MKVWIAVFISTDRHFDGDEKFCGSVVAVNEEKLIAAVAQLLHDEDKELYFDRDGKQIDDDYEPLVLKTVEEIHAYMQELDQVMVIEEREVQS